MQERIIVGIHVGERVKNANKIQNILTDFGCSIKTRIGLHETNENFCSPAGLLIIDFVGGKNKCNEMTEKLGKIDGVKIQKMDFPVD